MVRNTGLKLGFLLILLVIASSAFSQDKKALLASIDDIKKQIDASKYDSALQIANDLVSKLEIITSQSKGSIQDKLEATALFAAFKANEMKASMDYGNKELLISCVVSSIETGYDESFSKIPTIIAKTDVMERVVFEFTNADMAALSKIAIGQTVLIRGTIREMSLGISLKIKGCKLAK